MKGIIVASFGTSFEDTRKKCIESIENKIKAYYPDLEVRRAFTSHMIIKKLKERDGIHVNTPTEALQKMIEEGFTSIHVQPLHIIPGFEYEKVKRAVSISNHKEGVEVTIGHPLLAESHHYDETIEVLNSRMEKKTGHGYLLMGHGTEHHANACYSMLQSKLMDNRKDVYVVNVEGYPEIEDRLESLKGFTSMTLMPLMLVAGDHARNDMAGDEEDSLKSILESHGVKVDCKLEGLGEINGFQSIFLNRVKEFLKA